MAGIQIKRIKWLQRPTAWQHASAWREARKAMVAKFQDTASIATNAFSNAWQGQITGSATLAAQAAVTRLQAETAARAQANANAVDLTA